LPIIGKKAPRQPAEGFSTGMWKRKNSSMPALNVSHPTTVSLWFVWQSWSVNVSLYD